MAREKYKKERETNKQYLHSQRRNTTHRLPNLTFNFRGLWFRLFFLLLPINFYCRFFVFFAQNCCEIYGANSLEDFVLPNYSDHKEWWDIFGSLLSYFFLNGIQQVAGYLPLIYQKLFNFILFCINIVKCFVSNGIKLNMVLFWWFLIAGSCEHWRMGNLNVSFCMHFWV